MKIFNPLSRQAADEFEQFINGIHAAATGENYKYGALIFIRWIKKHNLTLETLTQGDILNYIANPSPNKVCKHGRIKYGHQARRFLIWLYENGKLAKNPKILFPPALYHYGRKTHPWTSAFVTSSETPLKKRTILTYLNYINHFHFWQENQKIPDCQINEKHLGEFDLYLHNKNYCYNYRCKAGQLLRVYFFWLFQKGKIKLGSSESFRLSSLRSRLRGQGLIKSLTPSAIAYLEWIGTHRTKATYRNHQASIAHLHKFLASEGIKIEGIRRRDMEEWLKYLKRAQLAAPTRKGMILMTRVYLRWLKESGELKGDPEILLKNSDLPPKTFYLPRPIPLKLDIEIQKRLHDAGDIICKSLLLMRLAGLRIGELQLLQFNCVWTDHKENHLLKVPPGKLLSERAIPLTEVGYRIIQEIQKESAQNWLSFHASPAKPEKLIINNRGNPPQKTEFRGALHYVCFGLESEDPITTHRLRHTFATTLLNGGMSLPGLMRLMGHRHTRMTLRYAELAPETLREQYLSAMKRIEEKYEMFTNEALLDKKQINLDAAFTELQARIKQVSPQKSDPSQQRQLSLLIKRINRLKDELLITLEN